ncbi:Protein of unknown function (DUF581) [Quillaja saponaria]|uniref:FLZ-type domain-containing protein n=1 Tax=Quillaja saponaria TaxID=32244 RepID=A0AAD7LS74_QUISA|nr:Protein of unknown function (DUF581) [Quillaja saponaria]
MMLPKFMSPFKVETHEESCKQLQEKLEYKKSSYAGGNYQISTVDVGLRTLITQTINSKRKSKNVVVKSALRSRQQKNNSLDQLSCFLKTCNLCNKKFSPDKDIYMYRGDQGFCSVECRNRQIALDEIRELQTSTKQMVSSYRQQRCSNDARNETRLILEELQSQRYKSKKPFSCNNQNHWEIVS